MHSAKTFRNSVNALPALLFATLAFLWAAPAFAQDLPAGDVDVNALFGGDLIETPDAGAPATDPVRAALVTEKVRIGGSFSGSAAISATWLNPWTGGFDIASPDSSNLSARPSATIFFDARPAEDFRVYGSTRFAWPFSVATTEGVSVPNVRVFELFSDFSAGDRLFFRFGKSTVKWGVGYFWSPADVINIAPIDALDPNAQREGPVSFRVHLPIPGTQTNLYSYVVFDESDIALETTAIAAKAEFLAAGFEIGLGAWYRFDTAERAMATISGSLGPLNVFAEVSASRGSAKTFVTSIAPAAGIPPYSIGTSGTAENREDFFVSATAGFSYLDTLNHLSIAAQYFLNGEGYSDADRAARISEARALQALLPAGPMSSAFSAALKGLVYGSGRHYGAFNVSIGDFPAENLTLSLIVLSNLSDGSGFIRPSFAWKIVDRLTLTASPVFAFGGPDSEYVILNGGPSLTLSLSASLGSGSF